MKDPIQNARVLCTPTLLHIQPCALCKFVASARSASANADAIHDHTVAAHLIPYVSTQ